MKGLSQSLLDMLERKSKPGYAEILIAGERANGPIPDDVYQASRVKARALLAELEELK